MVAFYQSGTNRQFFFNSGGVVELLNSVRQIPMCRTYGCVCVVYGLAFEVRFEGGQHPVRVTFQQPFLLDFQPT